MIAFEPFKEEITILGETVPIEPIAQPQTLRFPPIHFDAPIVNIEHVHNAGYQIDETTYLALGGGLGSLSWVDFLRVSGVPVGQIKVIGFEPEPYGRYKRLASNSQIPNHERLRSNSDACPDNPWGWPGYGVREAWRLATRGRLFAAGKIGWQLMTEPLFSAPYTPRAGDVYRSVALEAKRINWSDMYVYGRIRAIRKTTDGRYIVAYSQDGDDQTSQRLMIASYVHLALGYPAVRFLPDLQAYREETHDFEHVVNAYEEHGHLYERLEKYGGTVLVRGRGIVASRIVQRLYEARQKGAEIGIIHLMRSKIEQGSRVGLSERQVNHHWELQPYNFPKACFGGDLKKKLEKMSDDERAQLLGKYGGTTTADRPDWQAIINQGMAEGWYQIRFGKVERVTREEGKIVTRLASEDIIADAAAFHVDYVIDCTGLRGDVTMNPLLEDLIGQYELPLNKLGRMKVSDAYELEEMRHGDGRMYAAGAMTYGNSFAPVDSFLGLQYVAQLSAGALVAHQAPYIEPLEGWRSFWAWTRWARGVQP